MSVLENIKMAFSSLRAHKMRSILTMLGIIIGVGSVIAVVAIGQGGEAVLKSQFTGESNTISLYYMPSDEELESNASSIYEDAFTQEDIKLIETIPEVEKVVATSTESSPVRYHQESTDGTIMGINQAYLDVQGLEIAEGRNLLAADFLSGARVAIVGDGFKEDLFEDDDEELLGKVVYIGAQPVEIVGVIESEEGFFSFGSNTVYVPMKTWQSVFAKTSITEVSIKAEGPDELKVAGERAADLLNTAHDKEDSYQILNMEEMAEGIGKITRIMTIIISSIAGVSLLVGGIGVMNIMLVSVTERTREIGVRMSLGATRGQILFQFLIEAVTLTLIGGLIGMALGTGAALIVSHYAGWPPLVSIPVIIGGILFSMFIGIIFGLLPANKASRLDPIESLRYE
ncbi:ABC transporter permease [Pseudogracilibacillus auburnensis]|uniref:Putative ABC transport system permease protein n=1 Tax=Pseudogracilibacillus auburnensis TaxID=1494959 RepID=A0A2V3W6S9_9BACI|nr:ABC transporter permease [Pseudogracilibacillus auburnensis]PXW87965.1 putative ABC transport system permease protein [Pseudogracilibacillus auburnensis]